MARAGGKEPERLEDAVALAEKTIIEALAQMKVLALDYGAARTGVAISDATGTLARPLTVVERAGERGRAAASSSRSSAAEGAERIVVGLPLTLAVRKGCRRTRPPASSTRSARPSTFPSSRSTSGSRRRSPPPARRRGRRRTRAPPRTCSRAT